jgi:hypothetical protein
MKLERLLNSAIYLLLEPSLSVYLYHHVPSQGRGRQGQPSRQCYV